MSHSHGHSHGGDGAACNHSHGDSGGSSCSHSHSKAASSSAAFALPASHHVPSTPSAQNHAHGGDGKDGTASECDYCASILAHGAAMKAATLRAKEAALRRAQLLLNPLPVEYESDSEDEETLDEREKLILPAQRVEYPLDRRIVSGFTFAVIFLALKVARSIFNEKAGIIR